MINNLNVHAAQLMINLNFSSIDRICKILNICAWFAFNSFLQRRQFKLFNLL